MFFQDYQRDEIFCAIIYRTISPNADDLAEPFPGGNRYDFREKTFDNSI